MSRPTASRVASASLGDRPLLALVVRFLLVFAGLFGALVWLGAHSGFVAGVEVETARAAALLMNLTGVTAIRVGTLISLPGRVLNIGPECTGLTIVVLLTALVLAYPVRFSSRVVGVLLGTVAILGANLVRLVTIAHVSGAPDAVFMTLHDFLFQVVMVGVAVAVWACWLAYARTRES